MATSHGYHVGLRYPKPVGIGYRAAIPVISPCATKTYYIKQFHLKSILQTAISSKLIFLFFCMAFSCKYSGGEVTIMLVVKVNKKNDFGNFRKNPRFAPNVSVEIRMHQRPGLNTVPFTDFSLRLVK